MICFAGLKPYFANIAFFLSSGSSMWSHSLWIGFFVWWLWIIFADDLIILDNSFCPVDVSEYFEGFISVFEVVGSLVSNSAIFSFFNLSLLTQISEADLTSFGLLSNVFFIKEAFPFIGNMTLSFSILLCWSPKGIRNKLLILPTGDLFLECFVVFWLLCNLLLMSLTFNALSKAGIFLLISELGCSINDKYCLIPTLKEASSCMFDGVFEKSSNSFKNLWNSPSLLSRLEIILLDLSIRVLPSILSLCSRLRNTGAISWFFWMNCWRSDIVFCLYFHSCLFNLGLNGTISSALDAGISFLLTATFSASLSSFAAVSNWFFIVKVKFSFISVIGFNFLTLVSECVSKKDISIFPTFSNFVMSFWVEHSSSFSLICSVFTFGTISATGFPATFEGGVSSSIRSKYDWIDHLNSDSSSSCVSFSK